MKLVVHINTLNLIQQETRLRIYTKRWQRLTYIRSILLVIAWASQ